MNEKPVWKTILSVAVCLFAVIRLAITCSKTSNRSSYSDTSYENVNSLIQNYRNEDLQSNDESNDLFYENYDSINKLNEAEKAIFRVAKVKSDTLVPIDLTSKISVEPKSFIQKNHDDSLQMAVKLPDNTSIFLHAYSSKDDMMDNFKALKKKKNIANIQVKVDDPNSKFVGYTYQYGGKKYNGYALLATENGQFTSLEFENNKLSKEDLQMKAITFVSQIAK
ncbi:MAG: hypothetical protein DI622_11135 [Chryseobacterium sp.]|uniref:hypothetical protein n=1 Tax=Chryseobacterium sp. TaxID=1871047 RepID=UPI000DB22B76|nr:hypothetical protein [Chryseobacterium sp.]MPS65996.1 hypothetical protein [Chryseobacterium sp.]PZU16952.1 MAG: hypothetical protein DI622_11135 [Chryseobacterium sp.]